MELNKLKPGQTAVVQTVGGHGALRRHFLDMGVIPKTEITLVKFAPMGDPIEFKIHGYELTLRADDAKNIDVMPIKKKTTPKIRQNCTDDIEHPGFGENGKRHKNTIEKPLPDGAVLSFALAGNQNCGKTTLFNQLTGSNQHVGNFPGVTVDRKSGIIKGHPNTVVVDLPGIYSLSPYTSEEIVSRQYILDEKPTGIINIVDATNIERNLYLTMQLIELDIPIVLALNMMDEVKNNGGCILINKAEKMLGIPVVPISAAKNEGTDELIGHAVNIAKYREKPRKTDFYKNSPISRTIGEIMHLIEGKAKAAGIPTKFAAAKLVEGDKIIQNTLNLDKSEKEYIEAIIKQAEAEQGTDRAAAVADMRFSFITEFMEKCVIKPKESKENIRSRKIDKILTGKYTALPMFAIIMAVVFWLTFDVIGLKLQQILEYLISKLTNLADTGLTDLHINKVLHSLIINGIFEGVGSVLSFLPIIVTLFFFLSMLEDTGYMARVAFITDKLLRKIGLSGRSIVPMLIGFGCSVPAVMASRTLPSERDRKMTITLIPFMSCTAKLPIYSFFTAAFFPNNAPIVMLLLYFGGIAVGILTAFISKKTVFRGEAVPFVMELPNYRLPSAKTTLHLLWEKAKDFLTRAFTVIFIATIVIWFLKTFDFQLNMVEDSKDSILAGIAGVIAPIFAPLGFGDWRLSTSLITGFIAKESVVSTLTVLSGSAEIKSILTPVSAASFLTFCLLYTPCVAAVAAIKRELGRKQAAVTVLFQCSVAWLCSGVVYVIGSIIVK